MDHQQRGPPKSSQPKYVQEMTGRLARGPIQQRKLAGILLQDGCDNLFLQTLLDESRSDYKHTDGLGSMKSVAMKMVTNIGDRHIRNSMPNYFLLTVFPTKKAKFEVAESAAEFEETDDPLEAQDPLPNPSWYRRGHNPVILTVAASTRSPTGTRIPTPVRQTPLALLSPNMVQCLDTDVNERCATVQRSVDVNQMCPSNVIHHAFWVPLGEWVLVMPPEAVGVPIRSSMEVALMREIKYDIMVGHLESLVCMEDAFQKRIARSVEKSKITADQSELQEQTRVHILEMQSGFQGILEQRIGFVEDQYGLATVSDEKRADLEALLNEKRTELRQNLEGELQAEIDTAVEKLKHAQAEMLQRTKEARIFKAQQRRQQEDGGMIDDDGIDHDGADDNDDSADEDTIERRNVPHTACPMITEITENVAMTTTTMTQVENLLISDHAIRLADDFQRLGQLSLPIPPQHSVSGRSSGSTLQSRVSALCTQTERAQQQLPNNMPPLLNIPVTVPATDPTSWAVLCYIPHPKACLLLQQPVTTDEKDMFVCDRMIVGMVKIVFSTTNKAEASLVERMMCDLYNDIFEFYTVRVGNRVRMPESLHAEAAAMEGMSDTVVHQHPAQEQVFGTGEKMSAAKQ